MVNDEDTRITVITNGRILEMWGVFAGGQEPASRRENQYMANNDKKIMASARMNQPIAPYDMPSPCPMASLVQPATPAMTRIKPMPSVITAAKLLW